MNSFDVIPDPRDLHVGKYVDTFYLHEIYTYMVILWMNKAARMLEGSKADTLCEQNLYCSVPGVVFCRHRYIL